MRLWHKDLIPVLPRQQLLAQWRECCCIARNIAVNGTPNHILVNKIMEYPIEHFYIYGLLVAQEMHDRGYHVDYTKFNRYFPVISRVNINIKDDLFKKWHNDRYLRQCYFNLQEKFDCDGIGLIEWEKIADFIEKYEWR